MHTRHFFLRSIIFSKTSRKILSCDYFVIAASVVQHSISSSHLLSDSVVPIACHMRNCPARIATEQVAAEKIKQAADCRKMSFQSWLFTKEKQKITHIGAHLLAGYSKWHERPEFLYTYRLPSAKLFIVCSAQTILSRSSPSQCPSALFNLTAAVVPRCTVFARE
jgi:hypothetical protein